MQACKPDHASRQKQAAAPVVDPIVACHMLILELLSLMER
jgi:hypothetical protein